jgi:YVTN family beta-propeller protein
MKNVYLALGLIAILGVTVTAFLWSSNSSPTEGSLVSKNIEEKVYVALEGEGKVAVVNPIDSRVMSTIDLSRKEGEETIRYMAHNVQVAPDGKNVLVTANVEEHMEMENGAMSGESPTSHGQNFDELIIIDPLQDVITQRIPIDTDSHLAHVVLTPDSTTAFVTLQEKGKIYSVDLASGNVLSKIDLGEKSGPHGLRITPDGSEMFIALLDGNALAVLNTKTGDIRKIALPGAAVQTAVTPDGAYAFSSVYDAKQIMWLDRQSDEQGLIALPNESRGPVQLYPTPDSKYLYVADQGYYFDQPTSNVVYRIDIARKTVDKTIVAGAAPHGVVVNAAGTRAYVTNLLSDDLTIIDTNTNQEITRIPVGDMPNGVSVWTAKSGGTP